MRDHGFTLFEVLVTLSLVVGATLSVAQLTVVTARDLRIARLQTATAALATSRLEELRSLEWSFDATGASVEDLSTNLASESPGQNGSGLAPSPGRVLEENTAGYVDFLDTHGRWVSSGPDVPRGAAFVRRWAVERPADGSTDSLVIQVLVRPVTEDVPRSGRRPAFARGETRLVSLRTRVAR